MNWQEEITLAIAVLGAVLGVLNFWRSVDRDRVFLKVVPSCYFTSHGERGVCVDVINLGFIPVTVNRIGFDLTGGEVYISLLNYMGGESLPKRLEPRTSFTFYFPPVTFQDPKLARALHASARTACGKIFTGNSPALRSEIAACAERQR